MGLKKGRYSSTNMSSASVNVELAAAASACTTMNSKKSRSCGAGVRFRDGVMALMRTHNQAAAAPIASELVLALVSAEETDAKIEGALLGMAAAQSARLQQHVLLGPLCMFASLRLATCGGREVAELATAAWKLGRPDPSFLRAVAEYCTSPPVGAFKSMRDIAMLALIFFQSVKGGMALVDHASALRGLTEVSVLHLQQASVRDTVEFTHALTHSLEARSLIGDVPLWREPAIEPMLHEAFKVISSRLHLASAFDVAMTAGAAAAAWHLLDSLRESILQPCLIDCANATRFRRADFNIRDLALLATAFAKTDISNTDFVGVLNEVLPPALADIPVRDLSFFLWAAAHISGLASEPFAAASAGEVARRKVSTFGPQDLCMLVQSLAKLGHGGSEPLALMWEAIFRRQLLGFSPREKAICLSVLSQHDASKKPALCKMLVRSLAAGDYRLLDQEQLCATVAALANVWPLLAEDFLARHLICHLIKVQPWSGARPTALAQLVLAFAKLSGELAMSQAGNVWDPVTAGAAASEAGAELAACLRNGETLMEADAQRLVASLRGSPTEGNASLLSPWLVAELLNLLAADQEAARPDSGNQPPRSRGASCDSPRSTCSESQSLSSETIAKDELIPRGLRLTACRFGSPSSSPAPLQTAGARGRSPCRKCGQTCGRPRSSHSHGRSHGHTHDHSHGHGHEADQDGDGEPDSEPLENFSNVSRGGICEGESSHAGHAHGHLQQHSTRVTAHENDHNSGCDDTGCRAFGAKQHGGVWVNKNCDFPGHCVQMKNTFLHIHCNDPDFDCEGGSCVVCHLARSMSVPVCACRAIYDTNHDAEEQD